MSKILKTPFSLVAEILEIRPELLNENSAMGEAPNWDSLKHIEIIIEMEKEYGLKIRNEEIENYMTMKSIIGLYESCN